MQYLGNKPVQGIGRSKNLFNEDILVEYGAEKLASGEYYFKYSSTPYRKKLWENTENYQGKMVVTADISWVYPGSTSGGINFRFAYTDGTYSSFNSNPVTNGGYYKVIATSKDNKIISSIECSYGTGICQTYLKNIMVNYGDTALPYQPYLQRYDMYMYDNLFKNRYDEGLSKTVNGITFTVDEQTGLITANGTSTKQAIYYPVNYKHYITLNKGKYTFKIDFQAFTGISTADYIASMDYFDGGTRKFVYINNNYNEGVSNKKIIQILNDNSYITYMYVGINVAGVTCNNVVFKPELIKLIGD